jgi:hypothetical protein
MNVNAELAKENPNTMLVSTSGLLINLSVVLLRLCGPFMPPSTKHTLIDPHFLCLSQSIFPQDITCLVPTSPASQRSENKATQTSAKSLLDFNFITQCFYLTVRAIHLGAVSTMVKYTRLMRHFSYVQSHMSEDPRMQMQFENMVVEKMILDAKLLLPELLHEMIRFLLVSAQVMCRICLEKANTDEVKRVTASSTSVVDQNPLTLPVDTSSDGTFCHHDRNIDVSFEYTRYYRFRYTNNIILLKIRAFYFLCATFTHVSVCYSLACTVCTRAHCRRHYERFDFHCPCRTV